MMKRNNNDYNQLKMLTTASAAGKEIEHICREQHKFLLGDRSTEYPNMLLMLQAHVVDVLKLIQYISKENSK